MFVDPKKRICFIYLISALVIGVFWGAVVQRKPILLTFKNCLSLDIWWSKSARLDYLLMFVNKIYFLLISNVWLSSTVVTFFIYEGLHEVSPAGLAVEADKILVVALFTVSIFIIDDFTKYLVHWSLHNVPVLWVFHKVHHSVEEMGYGAHLRFHWMENIFYTPMKFLIMMIIGNFSPENAFIVYYFSIAIGHLNHANIGLSYGVFKYIFNNPRMHIWHHAHYLPENHKNGVNFGISLSIWDYIFKTAYIPKDGKDIKIGFDGISTFPKDFIKQCIYGFKK